MKKLLDFINAIDPNSKSYAGKLFVFGGHWFVKKNHFKNFVQSFFNATMEIIDVIKQLLESNYEMDFNAE